MIDEAHRTQYGRLASKMRAALPNATFLGFTGTPIDKGFRRTTTAANVSGVTEAQRLLHGAETAVWGDAGYQGAEKRPEHAGSEVRLEVAMRPGLRRQLLPGGAEAQAERRKASVRAKAEHPFLYGRRHFGYAQGATGALRRTASVSPRCSASRTCCEPRLGSRDRGSGASRVAQPERFQAGHEADRLLNQDISPARAAPLAHRRELRPSLHLFSPSLTGQAASCSWSAAVSPGGGLVVAGAGPEAAVQVADEAVGERAERLVVEVASGAPPVVRVAPARAHLQRAHRPLVGSVVEPQVADEARLHGPLAAGCYRQRRGTGVSSA